MISHLHIWRTVGQGRSYRGHPRCCALTWLDDDDLHAVLAQRLVAAQAPPAQAVLAGPVHSLQTSPDFRACLPCKATCPSRESPP